MKHTKIKTNHGLIIIIVSIFLFGLVIYLLGNTNKGYAPERNTAINSGDQTTTYKSKDLKFTVNIPSKFQIEERFTTVLLQYHDELIQITRSGTNYSSLDAHLDNLGKLNDFTFSTKENFTINNYSAVKGVIEGEIHYFIYVDNWVYSISTPSESLFSALDQIAQSFRYTP